MQVAGHHIHHVTQGSGDPTLMVHCALSSHAALLPLAQAIGGQVTLCDLPGHGRSADWDGQDDYHRLITDVTAACCDGPTHVIGHSLGATAALRVAVEQPALVTRLTLIEPVYFAAARDSPAHRAHGRDMIGFAGAMDRGDRATAAERFNALWGAAPWAVLPERARTSLCKRIHLIPASTAGIEGDDAGITSAARLAGVDIPVTLIRGSATQPVIGDIHTALAARLPDATDHIVPGAAHMLPLTHMHQTAAIIRRATPENH